MIVLFIDSAANGVGKAACFLESIEDLPLFQSATAFARVRMIGSEGA